MGKKNDSTPLSVMLGSGDELNVKGEAYIVKPITLEDTDSFMKDNISIGTQIFNITDKAARKKVDKWLTKYCFDGNDEPVTLEKAMGLGWDVVDLKNFFKKLCDLSG